MAGQPATRTRIPTFTSIEEEATFWDTHDSTEFEDEWEPAEVEFAKPLEHTMAVPFDAATLGRIIAVARARGVKTSHLMRDWIQAELERAEATSGVTASPTGGEAKQP